jgi:phosphate-selective porin
MTNGPIESHTALTPALSLASTSFCLSFAHKTNMSTRCPKWGTKLKADFRRHIEARRINPNKTDRAYILSIRHRYYKGRPDATFIKNYNASVAEWRIGHYVNEYNKGKGEMFSFILTV